jgi:hypothetical protein
MQVETKIKSSQAQNNLQVGSGHSSTEGLSGLRIQKPSHVNKGVI